MTTVIESATWEEPPKGPARHRRGSEAHPDDARVDSLLPQPPLSSEKYSYIRRYTWVLTAFSVVSLPGVVYTQFLMARNSPWLWAYVPFLIFTILYWLISLFVNGVSRGFDLDAHRGLVHSWRPGRYPSVDVFLPVCGEALDVLRNTWTHVAALRRHYPGPVTPCVLDDAANPEVRKMAAEFGFRYGIRPNRGWFKKAGNLHYGFRISHSEFILLLDADFAPRHDLLDELLPYFAADQRLGIIQSPQFFRILDRQSWVERGAGAVQELFYRCVQPSFSQRDGAICCGTCAVYRRAALADNGGMTLIEHSEDLHTGFDLRQMGWGLKYVPVALSTGACPDNVPAFLNQQYRWGSGTMSLLGSRKFWTADLRLSTRLCYISGFVYYLHTAVFTFIAPMIPIMLLLAEPGSLQWHSMVWVLPGLLYTGVIFPMWHRCPYRLEAYACRTVYGWAHVFVIWDILRKKRQGWQPSGSGAKKQRGTRRLWIGMIGWSGGTAVVWVALAFWRTATMDPLDFAILLVAGLFNAAVIGRCLIQPRTGAAA